MATNYTFTLRGYSEAELYDYLKAVIEKARVTFDRTDKAAYAFQRSSLAIGANPQSD